MAQRLWLLLVPFAWHLLVQGQGYGEFDYWACPDYISSVMVENKIYYDYGWTLLGSVRGFRNFSTTNNPYLWVLDLSSEFNVSKVFYNISLSSFPQLKGYKKSPDIPRLTNGIMWATRDGTIYETGGYVDYSSLDPADSIQVPMSRRRAIWSFSPTTEEWGLVQTNGDEINRVSHAAYASAPSLDLHFAVGGVTTIRHQAENYNYPPFKNGTVNNGMTIFDSGSLSLKNRTLEDLAEKTNTMPSRKEGWCEHIPVGAKGMLVCHTRCTGPPGGQVIRNVENSPNSEKKLIWANYEAVDLYDIANDKWHSQPTSTDETGYPLFTLSGCAAVGSDGKTWEIYMTGSTMTVIAGHDEYVSRQDIWVLTIPAFHWFRIPADHNRMALAGHGCHIIGKQLITVSGVEVQEVTGVNQTDINLNCTGSPFRVYDLEHLKWTDYFVPSNYAPPKVVADFVKDPKHDHPRLGWANPEVEALVKGQASTNTSDTSPSTSPSTSPDNSSDNSSEPPPKTPSKDLRGAIAGGAVGGLIGVIVCVALFFYLRSRARGAGGIPPWELPDDLGHQIFQMDAE